MALPEGRIDRGQVTGAMPAAVLRADSRGPGAW
jgi:hypothetical protein